MNSKPERGNNLTNDNVLDTINNGVKNKCCHLARG